jgi:hypothetical protein
MSGVAALAMTFKRDDRTRAKPDWLELPTLNSNVIKELQRPLSAHA